MRKPYPSAVGLVVGLLVLFTAGSVGRGQAPPPGDQAVHASDKTQLTRVLRGRSPEGVQELRALQARIRTLTESLRAATVAIQVGRANGSGVIVESDGVILTAAHVAGRPNRRALVFLSDGQVAHGITLGMNPELDSGMIRITDPGPWPAVPMGKSGAVREGQWVLATGHPGGYDQSRPPVLRFGRVFRAEEAAIVTDCTLVGGDSGGPLFNLDGEVVGIHSRIGKNLTVNLHVPIDIYRRSWQRYLSGETWGGTQQEEVVQVDDQGRRGWLGVYEDPTSNRAKVARVQEDSPADRAGIAPGDVILQIDDETVDSFRDLQQAVSHLRPGVEVLLKLRRGERLLDVPLRIGSRRGAVANQ